MAIERRALFRGLIGLAAPAIIRTPGLLMPVKKLHSSDILRLFSLVFENVQNGNGLMVKLLDHYGRQISHQQFKEFLL